MQDMISEYQDAVATLSPIQMIVFFGFVIFISFIPTYLGFIRNRKHIGKIFLLNIPLCFTLTGWFILMGVVLIKFDNFEDLKKRVLRRKKPDEATNSAAN